MTGRKTFPDLTQVILDASGLVDVAPQGRARQSSLSNWSIGDDAQRAVSQLSTRDFAFHTDLEDAPWWELSFETPQNVEMIVISNRKNESFRHVSRSLCVEVSEDGKTWTTIHAGNVLFGVEGDGVPLILPVSPEISFRVLRLSLRERGYLHLSAVRLLSRSVTGATLTFASERADGFGERVKGILNAMVLADLFDANFAFNWPSFSSYNAAHHSVDSPEDAFSPAFLKAHHHIPAPKVDFATFTENSETTRQSVIVPHDFRNNMKLDRVASLPPAAFSEAFDKIGFSERLMKAIRAARAIDLASETVGLHLRAGDIVYGRYRFNRRYTNKVVPYPLCMAFVEAERAAGRDVLLFGQDTDLCRQIAASTGARFSEEFHVEYGFDNTQAALFDIVAMSRCARVVAGQSGFSQLAQRIGLFEMIDPRELMTQEAAADVLCKTLLPTPEASAGLSPSHLQIAFAAWYAAYFYKDLISPSKRIDLLRLALKHDPKNDFYGVMLSIALYEVGHVEAAEAELTRLMAHEDDRERFGSLQEIARTVHPDGSHALLIARPVLERMGKAGIAPAAALAAVIARQTKDESRAAVQAELAGAEGGALIEMLSGPTLR